VIERNMRRRSRGALVAAIGLSGLLLGAGAAQAATRAPESHAAGSLTPAASHTCTQGDFCVYTDYVFGAAGGQTWAWPGDDLDWWRNDGGAAGPNNQDHSWWNHGYQEYYDDVVVYKYGNGGSGQPSVPTVCIPWTQYATGHQVPSADGQGSAHEWSHGCPSGVPIGRT
jgi:hypothetical protein